MKNLCGCYNKKDIVKKIQGIIVKIHLQQINFILLD